MTTPTQVEFLNENISYNGDRQEEYKGWAIAGSKNSDATWLIRKTFYTNNQKVMHRFANSTLSFNQVWDDRAGLTYG